MKKLTFICLLSIVCILNGYSYVSCWCGDHASGITTYDVIEGGCCSGVAVASNYGAAHTTYALDEGDTWTMVHREWGSHSSMQTKCCGS